MRPYLLGALVGVLALALVAGAGVWWIENRADHIRLATIDIPLEDIVVPDDSASLVEGERIAWLRGCHGCHADSMQGRIFADEPRMMRLVTPNIPETITRYTDAELARLIRHGISREGRTAYGMPSATFYHLSDGDVGRLIAHLRAAPRVASALPATEFRFMANVALIQGKWPSDAATMNHQAPRLGDRADTSQLARGEYLAITICSECHGVDLRGQETTPGLPHAIGYTLPEFRSLLLDGRARDGKDIGLMATTARRRFSRLAPGEIEAIFAYLSSMSLTP